MANKSNHLSSLEGYWLEEIPKSPNRRYSVGQFIYHRDTKSYSYDGANYTNDGRLFCTWKSTNLTADIPNKKIYYIFEASKKDELYNVNYGFGVINVELKDGKAIPVGGFYRETLINAVPFSHDF